MSRLALLSVEPDPADRRVLKWKFRHDATVIMARSLRNHPVVLDVQQLGLLSREIEISPAVKDEIAGRISEMLPILRYERRSA